MGKLPSQGVWNKITNWSYDKALSGFLKFDSAFDLAEKNQHPGASNIQRADAIIRKQRLIAGSSGFVSGLGGFLSLPAAIPANLATVIFIQIRMVAAIAHLAGNDIRDPKVKDLIMTCIAGNTAKEIVQETAIRTGKMFTRKLVNNISSTALSTVNSKVGFFLLTKNGGKGLINVSKAVPFAGGLIGGTTDVIATSLMGRTAKRMFLTS